MTNTTTTTTEKIYTQKEMDEAIEAAYERGSEDGYDSAAKSYEYGGY